MKRYELLPKITLALLILVTLLVVYTNLAALAGIPYVPLMTPLVSLLAFAFAVLHAGQCLGWPKGLLLLAITFSISLLFESVGVATGWVYGGYHYTEKLGWKVLGLVPLLIPIAWIMMSYPSLVITLRIVPVAPFTVVNLVAGASHISFRDFALGTLLGMLAGSDGPGGIYFDDPAVAQYRSTPGRWASPSTSWSCRLIN